jgi:predicted site-specific integrase-resolvase
MPKHFTAGKAAKLIGCSRMALFNWIREGRIQPPPIPAGRKRPRWTVEDIERVKSAREKFVSRRGRRRKIVDAGRVARLRAQGASWNEISRQIGCAPQTARRAL